jgi:hypothetical protein
LTRDWAKLEHFLKASKGRERVRELTVQSWRIAKSKIRYLNLIQTSPTFTTLLTLLPKLSHFPTHQPSKSPSRIQALNDRQPQYLLHIGQKAHLSGPLPHPPSKLGPNDQYTPHPGIRAQPYQTTSHFSGRLEPHTRVSRLHQGSTSTRCLFHCNGSHSLRLRLMDFKLRPLWLIEVASDQHRRMSNMSGSRHTSQSSPVSRARLP